MRAERAGNAAVRLVWHVLCSKSLGLSWWLGFRIRLDGWSKSCRLSGRNPRGARRDKIPGDLSGQELAARVHANSEVCESSVELAMNVSDFRKPAKSAKTPRPIARLICGIDRGST
jgi:hypothetical protein